MASVERLNHYNPDVGRFTSGSLTEKQTKRKNKPIAEDKQRYEFGVAYPKTGQGVAATFGAMSAYCQRNWANDPAKMTAFNNWYKTLDGLSMKVSDGDAPNAEGKVNENHQGHFVFWFSSMYPPKFVDRGNQEIPGEAIKRGDYVQMAMTFADNELPLGDGCGLYINPDFVRLVGIGEAISGGISADEAFGGTAENVQLPPGAALPGANVGMPSTGAQQPGNALPGVGPSATGGVSSVPGNNPNAAGAQTLPGAAPSQDSGLPGTAPGQTASGINPHTGILNGPAGLPGQ